MNEPRIEVGRRVRYHLPYGDSPIGVIVEINGELQGIQPRSGPFQVIRPGQATFTIITFDGRRFDNKREHDVGRLGIGCVDLLDRVHSAALVALLPELVAKRQAAEVLERAKDADDFHRREAAREIVDPPLFYWNGIKDAKGAPLQKAYYSDYGPNGSTTGKFPPHTICIYARDYNRFSAKVGACFAIQNDSDIQTDYFDSDRAHVIPAHPLYPQVKAALDAQEAHRAKRAAR